jgi:hypothetical protein
MRRLLFWLVLDGPRLPGRLAPWLFGLAIGSKPRKVNRDE